MEGFLEQWGQAAYTTAGFFWMALWAFVLGYVVSSMIQVFVTQKRMRKYMDGDTKKGVLLGTFFGFISSSCSFAALASTKSLFKKGASFVASIAFLLASTNLVIELGIVISIFLGWQFVVGEYVGGILLILISWLLIKILNPRKMIQAARETLNDEEKQEGSDKEENWQEKISSEEHWVKVARQYKMEWQMVWKDVVVGFVIAGIISSFVPDAFFETLFINTGEGSEDFSFAETLQHVVIGPVAAFLTFIGSMGNIPLAALLFGKGVSFAGVMAFIFSDLVVFPVLRINARYYGWKMSLFILFLLFSALIVASLSLHYSLNWLEMLPDPGQVNISERSFFKIDYTFYLNLVFLAISGYLIYLGFWKKTEVKHSMAAMAPKSRLLERIMSVLAILGLVWISSGLIVQFLIL
ncbi:permease [Nonlabens xiamenensis]|uniref:permease n=1 Tax=Nonlabens xiamenensis TaxID=2341043 RepID=UPI000F604B54|nr:permease [Nonlabens xiamenensis]